MKGKKDMKEIAICVTGAQALVTDAPILTSGRVGLEVVFTFTDEWEKLEKTAVFRCGSCTLGVLLQENKVKLPWEVLETPGCTLWVGVYGTCEDGEVLPTLWAEVGKVEPGTSVPEQKPTDHTPDAYCQILEIAKSVREDAQSGKFTPKKGVDYFTPEERETFVQAVLSALPTYHGEVSQ